MYPLGPAAGRGMSFGHIAFVLSLLASSTGKLGWEAANCNAYQPSMKLQTADFSRRHFLRAALAGPGLLPAATWVSAAEDKSNAVTFDEPNRSVTLVHDADVIVCGAGPAGVAAAVAAARAGDK